MMIREKVRRQRREQRLLLPHRRRILWSTASISIGSLLRGLRARASSLAMCFTLIRDMPRLVLSIPRLRLLLTRGEQVVGLPLAELNHLELQFLLLNDFRLAVPVEDLEAYA